MKQVAAAVIEKDGKVLIAQRKAGDALAGKWEFPGGKLEPGETPEQCLRRELMEEFGVDTEIGAFVCSSRFEYNHFHIELLAYRVRHIAGEFRLNDHAAILWVNPGELLNYDLASADIPVVNILVADALPFNPGTLNAAMPPGIRAELEARRELEAGPGGDPVCPDCKKPMVLRITQRGPNPGSKFWGCVNYPACGRTVPVKE
jgi:8-oxo-dGTP diphosphatase